MYKQTDIGAIPRDWVVCELADVASYSQNRVKASNSETNTYVSCDNMLKDKGGVVPASCVPETGSVTKYHAGNILIGNIRPYLKKIWLADKSGTCSADVLCLQTFENPIFLYNVLSSDVFFLHVMSNVKGTKMPRGDKPHIMQYKFPIPSDEEEQRAIATALADVDALIEAKRALLEKKRAIKQGTMQELLTGNRRLPGFPVTPMKHTEIGDLPEDWVVKELGSLACMKSGQSITGASIEENGDYPCYGGNGLRGYTKTYTHEGTFPLIGRQGALCGNVTLARNRFYASEHAVVVTPYQGVDAEWISWILIHMNLNSISEASAQGGLAVSKILKLKAPFPQREEQCAIAAVLSDMDAEIESLEQELVKLCNLKRGMMQNLLTGRIRLV